MAAKGKAGGAREAASARIREIIHEWERDGTIGNSRPATKQDAVKQAVAIALEEVRRATGEDPAGDPAPTRRKH